MNTARLPIALAAWSALLAAVAGGAWAGPPTTQTEFVIDLPKTGDVVALVNGQPVPRERLVSLLIERNGKEVLQALVALEVVRQAAAAKGVAISPEDIGREEENSYPPELRNRTPEERKALLEQYLQKNGLSRVDWQMTMERNAYLRKLADDVPAPKEEQLKRIFAVLHGEKVQVRHIELDSPAALAKAKARLKAGELFDKLAKEMSLDEATRDNGGLLDPLAREDASVPEEVRDYAFALKQPGQVSDEFLLRGRYHLLCLVRRIPADSVSYEDVKDKLADEFRQDMIRRRMRDLLLLLPSQSSIEILDPVIKRQAGPEGPPRKELALPGGTR